MDIHSQIEWNLLEQQSGRRHLHIIYACGLEFATDQAQMGRTLVPPHTLTMGYELNTMFHHTSII